MSAKEQRHKAGKNERGRISSVYCHRLEGITLAGREKERKRVGKSVRESKVKWKNELREKSKKDWWSIDLKLWVLELGRCEKCSSVAVTIDFIWFWWTMLEHCAFLSFLTSVWQICLHNSPYRFLLFSHFIFTIPSSLPLLSLFPSWQLPLSLLVG